MREWNAGTYHQISNPQFTWARPVVARLPLAGDELVLDIGCGTGRVTALLLERLPRGSVLGLDLSANMLAQASAHLEPRFGPRIRFARAEATHLPVNGAADAIFSTATFHWILDHPALFRSLFVALRAGGRVVAQCGGGANLAGLNVLIANVMAEPAFASSFRSWQEPWQFADAATTADRLSAAGFVDVETSVEEARTVMPSADDFAVYVANVICRHHLSRLPVADDQRRFIDRLTERSAASDEPFVLDYWRLNLQARKPI